MIIKKGSQIKKKHETVVENEQAEASAAISQEETQDIFAGFNFDEINFSQRAERRRGDRRRGYRRIDDRNLISRAQEEAIMIREQSSKEGFQRGIEEAHTALFGLKESLDEFFGYKDELYKKLTNDILEISLTVAQKIIKREVASDRTILNSIVQDALKSLAKDENKIILKVSPSDVEYTKGIVPELLSSGQIEAKIYVTGDNDVEEGSAVIEASNGVIDANIRTQLELIKEAFKQI
jgi:flagellar assembly protein FliH